MQSLCLLTCTASYFLPIAARTARLPINPKNPLQMPTRLQRAAVTDVVHIDVELLQMRAVHDLRQRCRALFGDAAQQAAPIYLGEPSQLNKVFSFDCQIAKCGILSAWVAIL